MPLYFGNSPINKVFVSFTNSNNEENTYDATLSSGQQMLEGVTAYSKGTKYTGQIPSKSSSDISVNGNTVNIPYGYYSDNQTKTIAKTSVPSPTISVSNSGLITALTNQTSGYVDAANKSQTMQLTTQSAKTITPSSSSQTAVSSGKYTTGDVIVAAVPTETKTITSNGTYTPTSGKWFSSVSVNVSSGSFETQAKTVNPSESRQTITPDSGYDGLSSVTVNAISSTYIGSGVTKKAAATITPGTKDQTIASGQYLNGVQTIKGDANLVPSNIISGKTIFGVAGNVAIKTYYTGSGEPSSSLGSDGDIYLKS